MIAARLQRIYRRRPLTVTPCFQHYDYRVQYSLYNLPLSRKTEKRNNV